MSDGQECQQCRRSFSRCECGKGPMNLPPREKQRTVIEVNADVLDSLKEMKRLRFPNMPQWLAFTLLIREMIEIRNIAETPKV